MPKSLNPPCIRPLDCVSRIPESPNCVSEVFVTDSDCRCGFDEVDVYLGGISTTVQPCCFLPLVSKLPVKRVKELKWDKSYKNNN